MGKKEQKKDHHSTIDQNDDKVEAVLHILRKQSPLTLKQEKFCNRGCVGRFLRIKGDNVKKAAKLLRSCLSWRSSLAIESLIADEFTAELAEGLAYVAGLDDECRPVLVFRIKQDYQKLHTQKQLIRLVVFTLEVAISTMSRNVEQFVILFDASFFKSAAAFMNILVTTLKIVAEYYPCRLFKTFVIDPPSLFSYLWKGVRTFVELSTATMIASMQDFQDSFDYDDFSSSYPSRVSSLRFDTSSIKSTDKIGSCASSRFAFTVSRDGLDTVKPWCLTLTDTSSSKLGHTGAYISPLNARSFSFASPAARSEPMGGPRRSFFASTPMPARTTDRNAIGTLRDPRIPRPSFFQSPAVFFRRESHVSKSEKPRDSFVQFLKFYRRPYDEMTYRSKMRPPLGGLVSIVSTHIRRRHVSLSQRF
ncbi:Phosphatidylinositol/phosphatidylcholine transfer protein SFH3 [Cardamine amara subsp. amara]|uniref:Phosphatidylinositol/phosphatidylcholine transfer protein SFH3 n=1 Tax=Cardamine amara subsp. amara TaxID=228776 RepID=A0ABD1B6X6_CARAN